MPMLSFDEALSRWLSLAPRLGRERASLDEADGRVLAEDLRSRDPLPRFDHSAMDGYALRHGDLPAEGAWELRVQGESAAGSPTSQLEANTAMRIFTGAPLPLGADTVVMQEDVQRVEGGATAIHSSFRPAKGAWVRRRGEDLERDAVAISCGTRLSPGTLALAAALDHPTLFVSRRPVVTILASGDELRRVGERFEGTDGAPSVVESNGYFIASAARRLGAVARIGPFVPDDLQAASSTIGEALVGSDLVVTIGGVSVGDHDVVRPALERAGVALEFHKVAMKPGKPLTVGRRGETLVLGLPGNPASASLTFGLFGAPMLRAMQGMSEPTPTRERAVITTSFRRSPGRTEFLRGLMRPRQGAVGSEVMVLAHQSSGAVTSFAQANALVIVPAERSELAPGDELEVLRIRDVLGD